MQNRLHLATLFVFSNLSEVCLLIPLWKVAFCLDSIQHVDSFYQLFKIFPNKNDAPYRGGVIVDSIGSIEPMDFETPYQWTHGFFGKTC